MIPNTGTGNLGKFSGQPDPGDHGFDHWFGTEVNALDGPESPGKFVRNGEKVGEVDEWYCDAVVSEAIDWMADRPDPEKPRGDGHRRTPRRGVPTRGKEDSRGLNRDAGCF